MKRNTHTNSIERSHLRRAAGAAAVLWFGDMVLAGATRNAEIPALLGLIETPLLLAYGAVADRLAFRSQQEAVQALLSPRPQPSDSETEMTGQQG